MTAREEGHGRPASVRDPRAVRLDELPAEQRAAVLADVADFRGDVTLTMRDGTALTGYVFSVETAGLEPHLKLFTAGSDERLRIPLASIAGCAFTGRDTADGRSWEAWVRRWEEKKRLLAQGVDVGDIEPKPEDLG